MISWASFLTIIGMLCVTYSTRLIGYFALRNRILSPRAKQMMEAAPGCVLISVIAPYFVSHKPHELLALAVALLMAARFSMLTTVLAAVAVAPAAVPAEAPAVSRTSRTTWTTESGRRANHPIVGSSRGPRAVGRSWRRPAWRTARGAGAPSSSGAAARSGRVTIRLRRRASAR